MSIETLRICMALEHDARTLQSKLETAELAYENAQRAFRNHDHLVTSLRQTLDRGDARAVDDFNLKVKEQNRLLDEYHALVDPYNEQIEALQATSARLTRDCSGSYLERDRLIVLQERDAAIKARMEATGKR